MVHTTAIVHPSARIGEGVEIGPYAIIGEHVSLGAGTWVGPHAVIEGWTEIGRDNKIFQFASVGAQPQDLKFHGEKSFLRLGDRNIVREFATIHRGTEGGGGETVIGDDCLFMAYTHVAHDCQVGSRVILGNAATLAGHVILDDFAILSALCAIHQFVRVGAHAMIGGGSMVTQDVPPYVMAQGDRAKPVGINQVGLKRRGFSEETIRGIKQSYKLVFRTGLRIEDALEKVDAQFSGSPEVKVFTDFIRKTQRGLAR